MKETLTKKLGPLPTWVWALIAVGGIAAFMLWKRSQSSSSANNAASSTGSSTLPAGSGYLVVPPSDSGNVQGFNNPPSTGGQGPGSTVGPSPVATPGFQQLLTVGDVFNAAKQGLVIFEQPTPGVFKPTAYTTATLTGFSKYPATALVSETGAVPLYAASTAAQPVQIAPGMWSNPGNVSGASGNIYNGTAPSQAIAPSALQPA